MWWLNLVSPIIVLNKCLNSDSDYHQSLNYTMILNIEKKQPYFTSTIMKSNPLFIVDIILNRNFIHYSSKYDISMNHLRQSVTFISLIFISLVLFCYFVIICPQGGLWGKIVVGFSFPVDMFHTIPKGDFSNILSTLTPDPFIKHNRYFDQRHMH